MRSYRGLVGPLIRFHFDTDDSSMLKTLSFCVSAHVPRRFVFALSKRKSPDSARDQIGHKLTAKISVRMRQWFEISVRMRKRFTFNHLPDMSNEKPL